MGNEEKSFNSGQTQSSRSLAWNEGTVQSCQWCNTAKDGACKQDYLQAYALWNINIQVEGGTWNEAMVQN